MIFLINSFNSQAFNFLKVQIFAGPNVNIVYCSNRNSSPCDLYKMSLVAIAPCLAILHPSTDSGTQCTHYVLCQLT
jgi:hypothetical protein